ncbi:hypothetical protein OKS35_01125 [Exiguobacterium sp. N5]|uniref:hypothetical protein n=1 Tax=unclassified Exiguobacterium TaxID=2644629 RepID=UPI001BED2C24|nr:MULTISPECIES: hypothetical protein [unclassified Exiguobacterium]MCV9898711.1 hypothetical protein [Exiguobacterium sp. N5]
MKLFYIILSSVVGGLYFTYIVHLFRIGFTTPLYTQIPMLLTIGVIALWLFNKRTERRS